MLDWEQGILFGQALEQLRSHEGRLADAETRLTAVETDHAGLKATVYRGALVGVLWAVGLATNLPADRVGEVAASFLKALSK